MKTLEGLFEELEMAVSKKLLREKRLHFFLEMLAQDIKIVKLEELVEAKNNDRKS